MQLSDYIQTGALIVSALSFFFGFVVFLWQNKKSREIDEKQLQNQKIEIYQTLETQSTTVFAFEAQNRHVLTLFKTHLARPDVFSTDGIFGEGVDLDDGQLVARKYYEISCNLFEVSSRLRNLDVMDHMVFGSWVAWFFDTAMEWGFRAVWHDLRDNYTQDLRNVFDEIVEQLIRDWDIPHAEGRFTGYDGPAGADGLRRERPELMVDATRLAILRKAFYTDMARIFRCSDIGCWLEEAERTRGTARHPLSYT